MPKVLVDTCVWIDHLHRPNPRLISLLEADEVFLHSMVLGELACGSLKPRARLLRDLSVLERAPEATTEEVLSLVERQKLYGKGLSWIDCHLLASAALAQCELFTLDQTLSRCAKFSKKCT